MVFFFHQQGWGSWWPYTDFQSTKWCAHFYLWYALIHNCNFNNCNNLCHNRIKTTRPSPIIWPWGVKVLGVRQIHFKRVGCELRLFATVYVEDKIFDRRGNLKKYYILLFCLGNQTNLVDKGGPSSKSRCTWISFLVTEKPTS